MTLTGRIGADPARLLDEDVLARHIAERVGAPTVRWTVARTARNADDRLGYLLASGDSRRQVISTLAEACAVLDVLIRSEPP